MQFESLSVAVKGKTVVKKLTLTVKPGELHFLLGPNGAGKSSLGFAVVGHPDYLIKSGKLLIDGENFLELAADERSKRGLFLQFQSPVEVPGVKVSQFLRQVYLNRLAYLGTNPLSVLEFFHDLEKLAKQVDLDPAMLSRGLNEGFSGGEKKRLEMLQLLVLTPRYVILDELDSGLDVDALRLVSKTIRLVQKRHQTGVLLITHSSRIMKYLTPNYVHIMVNGQLTQSGGAELFSQIESLGYKLETSKG